MLAGRVITFHVLKRTVAFGHCLSMSVHPAASPTVIILVYTPDCIIINIKVTDTEWQMMLNGQE